MNAQQGYYSLVQFCPDPDRAEVANIGVLLFSPAHNFIDAKLSTDTRRVRRIFTLPEMDTTQIKSIQGWVKERLDVERDRFQTLEDLEHFIGTRFNDIRLTEPRSIAVENPEEQLDGLFRELVVPVAKKQARGNERLKQSASYRGLERFFDRPQFADFVKRDQKVRIPVSGKTLDVPFVFTNGTVSLVRPERIASFDAAEKRLAEGLLLSLYADDEGKQRELLVMADVDNSKLRDQIGQLSAEVSAPGVKFFVELNPLMALIESKAAAA